MSTSRIRLVIACVAILVVTVSPSRAAEKVTPQIPAVQKIPLDTRDGVALRCTYYRGGFIENLKTKEVTTVPGTEVVPILMLHGWDGQRTDYDYTANLLQRLGHAVIVPDLRGHGDSVVRKQGVARNPDQPASMGTADIEAMVLDIEVTKKFLLERNNAQELNIELLSVVGAELGATLAVNWAVVDWSWPQLPAYKQGRDVKSLVLLSPVQSFKGTTLNDALKPPMVRSGLSMLIVVGAADEGGRRIAKGIHDRSAKARRPLPKDAKERQRGRIY